MSEDYEFTEEIQRRAWAVQKFVAGLMEAESQLFGTGNLRCGVITGLIDIYTNSLPTFRIRADKPANDR